MYLAELEECSTLKTGFDSIVAAGFDEGDTVTGIVWCLRIYVYIRI